MADGVDLFVVQDTRKVGGCEVVCRLGVEQHKILVRDSTAISGMASVAETAERELLTCRGVNRQ